MIVLPVWIDSLEKKAKWLSIPHLGMILVALQVIGFSLVFWRPELLNSLTLDPSAVLSGEVWRLVTFLAIPLSDSFVMLFVLWAVFYIFRTLSKRWGNFKFSLYFLIAWCGTVLGSFIFSTTVDSFMLIETTFLFAIAMLSPNYEVNLFYLLPIKMKWLSIFAFVLLILEIALFGTWQLALCVLLSCANFIVFFGPEIFRRVRLQLTRGRG
ncbi:MAG: hypothetical protein M0P13_08140 [Fibrobacteraceae bacterium]|nr:hypothetical protein [Fibrobacteraceae bacterium]